MSFQFKHREKGQCRRSRLRFWKGMSSKLSNDGRALSSAPEPAEDSRTPGLLIGSSNFLKFSDTRWSPARSLRSLFLLRSTREPRKSWEFKSNWAKKTCRAKRKSERSWNYQRRMRSPPTKELKATGIPRTGIQKMPQ